MLSFIDGDSVKEKSPTPLSPREIVEGVNIVKKHNKQSATTKAGIESIEKPIYLCKLSITDPKTKKPSRVGFKKLKDGKKVRFLKKSGETLT
ncbi:MAG: 50S ribosomal protein L24 [Alphaproteobacteria bacterium]